MIGALKEFADRLLGRGDATITVPSFDGALKPNQILEKAETAGQFEAPEDIATDGNAIYIADGMTIRRLDASGTSEVQAFRPPDHRAVLPGRTAASRWRSTAARSGCSRRRRPRTRAVDFHRSVHACGQRADAGQGRNADRHRRLVDAPRGAMGARSDGARPQRAGVCARSDERKSAHHGRRPGLRVRRLRRRATPSWSAKAGGIA